MDKSLTKNLTKKEVRTLKHIINMCLKYSIGFQVYGHGSFDVQHYDAVNNTFLFNESCSFKRHGQSFAELRSKLEEYIKHNVINK